MKKKNRPKNRISLLCLPCILFLAAACSFTYDTVSQNEGKPNLVMEDAEYVRMVNGNPEVRVQSRELRRYEANQTMELDELSFEQYNAAPEGQETIPDINARGKAAQARMETDTNNLYIRGDIVIEVVSEDIILEIQEISWQDKERLLSAPENVNITRSNGTTLKGKGFSADTRSRNWEFESAIEGSVVEDDEENTGEPNS